MAVFFLSFFLSICRHLTVNSREGLFGLFLFAFINIFRPQRWWLQGDVWTLSSWTEERLEKWILVTSLNVASGQDFISLPADCVNGP